MRPGSLSPAPRAKIWFDAFDRRNRYHLVGFLVLFAVVGGLSVSPSIPLLALPAMIAVLQLRYRLSLDFDARVYEVTRGFIRRSGTFADLKGIELDRRRLWTPEGDLLVPDHIYTVSLVWLKEEERSWTLGGEKKFADAHPYAKFTASRLDLPLTEGRDLLHYRASAEKTGNALPKI